MKVFLTGATGFVGQEVLKQTLSREHSVKLLVRSPGKITPQPDIEEHIGDTTDPQSLQNGLTGCDAVINLVGIIREHPKRGITFAKLHTASTRNMLQAAKEQGVSRFLQMSANGTRADAVTTYHKTKWAAEQLVRDSDLDWTIFRPSLIFGPKDQFINMLAGLIRKLPVVPVMGNGNYRLQPVSVKNIAEGFVNALETPESIGQIYHCGGPDIYSYNQLLDLIGAAMGKKSVCKLHHPLALMKPVVKVMQSIPQFPITRDQLEMLLEENICDQSDWQNTFKLELQTLPKGIAEYIS